MTRITTQQMAALAALLNRETGNAAEPYTNGRANVGAFYWSRAYGGWSLVQITNDAGGVRSVFGDGHEPARVAFEKAHAFRAGLSFAKEVRA